MNVTDHVFGEDFSSPIAKNVRQTHHFIKRSELRNIEIRGTSRLHASDLGKNFVSLDVRARNIA